MLVLKVQKGDWEELKRNSCMGDGAEKISY